MKKNLLTYAVGLLAAWILLYAHYLIGYEVAMRRVRNTIDMKEVVPKRVTVSTPPGPDGSGKYYSLTTFRFCRQGEDPVEMRGNGSRPVWRIQLDGDLTLYLD